MKYPNFLKILSILCLMAPTLLHAENELKKNPSLEEMSTAELREALKKSHAEIESRLGPASTTEKNSLESSALTKEKLSSLSEKHAYETSAQSRIDMLDYKIRALEAAGDSNWGYAQSDADKLKDIQSKAQEQLTKIKADNTDGWKINKQILDSLLS